MMYEMKNLFLPSEQGERTDNAFSLGLLAITSKHRDGHISAVTSGDIQDEWVGSSWSDSCSPRIPSPFPYSAGGQKGCGGKKSRKWPACLSTLWVWEWTGFCLEFRILLLEPLDLEVSPFGPPGPGLFGLLLCHAVVVSCTMSFAHLINKHLFQTRPGPGLVEGKRNVKYYIKYKNPASSLKWPALEIYKMGNSLTDIFLPNGIMFFSVLARDSYLVIDNVLYVNPLLSIVWVHCFEQWVKTGNGGRWFPLGLSHGDGLTLTKLKRADV